MLSGAVQITGVSTLNRCHPSLIIPLIKSAPDLGRNSRGLCGNVGSVQDQRDSLRTALAENVDLKQLKDAHHNEALQEWVMQTDRNKRVVVSSRGLVQETAFIHQMPLGRQAWNAPFYAPEKQIGSFTFKTPMFNILTLWGMSLVLYFILANRLPERWGWGRRLD